MHIIDTGWRSLKGRFQPYLHFQNSNGNREEMPIQLGKNIHWRITGPRRCTGYYQDTGWQPCPNDSVLRRNQIRCRGCSRLDEYSPCIRCRGDTCLANEERQKQCMETPYGVYLALFGNDIIKVGVSSMSRILLRWIEQGADYGAIIAEVEGGQEARKTERIVAKRTDISDAVHRTRKQSSMSMRLNAAAAEEIILEVIEEMDFAKLHQRPEIIDLSCYYGFKTLPSEPLTWLESNASMENSMLDGRICGVKGSNILVERKSALFIADLRRLLGYDLAQLKFPPETIMQSGLEHFL